MPARTWLPHDVDGEDAVVSRQDPRWNQLNAADQARGSE